MARITDEGSKGHVVVTGCSTGIGRATVLRLAQAGYHVFAAVRNERDFSGLGEETAGKVCPVLFDVTNTEAIARAAERIECEVGPKGLIGLVNNAGVSSAGPVEFLDIADLRRCFEVNVFGVVAVTQAFLPLLRTAGGRVVNMSSGAGLNAVPMLGSYCASKHALEAISDSLRIELRPSGVRVSLIEPGVVETPMRAKGDREFERQTTALPADGPAYYRESMGMMRERMRSGTGLPAHLVADAVLRALTSRWPRQRYAVGADVKVVALLGRWLPSRLMDGLLSRMAGLG